MADPPLSAAPAPRWRFRSAAVDCYVARREPQVLPRLVAPRTFRYLWLVLGLCALGGALLGLVPVPDEAQGQALAGPCGGGPALILALPADDLARLRAGQALAATGPSGAVWSGRVAALGPPLAGPAAAQARCGIDAALAGALSYPAAVVRLAPGGAPAAGLYTVAVRLGVRRLLSFAPRGEVGQ
ncbi:MAG TPA: hypothetical protein VKY74_23840 [Chloroflexia bacterium]|nr:hypothetical protein [Chloroflexia bacterium]